MDLISLCQITLVSSSIETVILGISRNMLIAGIALDMGNLLTDLKVSTHLSVLGYIPV